MCQDSTKRHGPEQPCSYAEEQKADAVTDFLCLGSKTTTDGDCSHEIRRRLLLGRETSTSLDSVLKKQRHYSANKGPCSWGSGLPSGHLWLWEMDCKESGALKNWCLQTVMLEKILESSLDSKEINPVNVKGNQPWILIGRTDAEVETPVFWSSNVNNFLWSTQSRGFGIVNKAEVESFSGTLLLFRWYNGCWQFDL